MSNTNQHGNCELKDEEIIKALECCYLGNRCQTECPLDSIVEGDDMKAMIECTSALSGFALDFINRKNAEIERLQKAIKVQDVMIEQQDYKIKSAKSEAIIEFAERLKEKIPYIVSHLGNISIMSVHRHIDNLVKEMAGD